MYLYMYIYGTRVQHPGSIPSFVSPSSTSSSSNNNNNDSANEYSVASNTTTPQMSQSPSKVAMEGSNLNKYFTGSSPVTERVQSELPVCIYILTCTVCFVLYAYTA